MPAAAYAPWKECGGFPAHLIMPRPGALPPSVMRKQQLAPILGSTATQSTVMHTRDQVVYVPSKRARQHPSHSTLTCCHRVFLHAIFLKFRELSFYPEKETCFVKNTTVGCLSWYCTIMQLNISAFKSFIIKKES